MEYGLTSSDLPKKKVIKKSLLIITSWVSVERDFMAYSIYQ